MDVSHIDFKTKNGHNMHGVEMGNGDTYVFLIHGLLNNWECWQELAQYADLEKFTFVAVEILGYGISDRQKSYSFDDSAEQVLDFIANYLETKGVTPNGNNVFLGGLSMGSILTAHIASKKSDLIDGYILMGAVFKDDTYKNGRKIVQSIMLHSLHTRLTTRALEYWVRTRLMSYVFSYLNMYKFNRALVDKYGVRGKQQVDITAYCQLGYEGVDIDTTECVACRKEGTKCLIVLGEADPYASVDKAASGELFENHDLGEYSVSLVEKAGHPVSYENPKGTYSAIYDFIFN